MFRQTLLGVWQTCASRRQRTRRRTHSKIRTPGLLLAVLWLWPIISVEAQTISPNVIEYQPSPEHWSTSSSTGEPVIDRYILTFHAAGSLQTLLMFDLGKPAPQADGMIRLDFGGLFGAWPLPGTDCTARVSAVGPASTASSNESNLFVYPCAFSLSPSSATVPAAGGAAAVAVTGAAHCGWSAVTSASWLTIASGSPAVGAGSLAFAAAPNPTTLSRSASISIGGQTFTVTQAALVSANQPPTVRITEPAANSINKKKFIQVSATASDSDGSIAKVEFFANGTLIERLAASPYLFRWLPSRPGPYTVRAVAYDNRGATASSQLSVLVR